jgi:hypothetical protein
MIRLATSLGSEPLQVAGAQLKPIFFFRVFRRTTTRVFRAIFIVRHRLARDEKIPRLSRLIQFAYFSWKEKHPSLPIASFVGIQPKLSHLHITRRP